ncbi:hypothetical protein PV342_12840 [Streptomyces sp. PA03-3a]|nr:hypothetical protein [Streptomyces sp. PA03-3a]
MSESSPSGKSMSVSMRFNALSEAGKVAILIAFLGLSGTIVAPLVTWALSQPDQGQAQASVQPLPEWVWPVTALTLGVLIAASVGLYLVSKRIKLLEAEREREALESAADRLREKMALWALVDFNRVLLNRYHGIATDQASKAYRSSRLAMHVGLGILVVAFVAGWRYNAQGDRLFVGSVAAVGTAFTAYLSRTYMKTYERALQQLNQYFNQPVLNGYFLTAERIADGLPESRKYEVLERVVADVLESGKEMHRSATGVSAAEATPKPRRGRRAAQADPTVPAQQTQ